MPHTLQAWGLIGQEHAAQVELSPEASLQAHSRHMRCIPMLHTELTGALVTMDAAFGGGLG